MRRCCTSASTNSGSVRQAVCTRTPAASPATTAPITSARVFVLPFEKQGLSHERRGESWHVAHRTRSSDPEQGRRRQDRRGPHRGDRPERREDRIRGQQRDRAAQCGPDRESQAFESNAVERSAHHAQERLGRPAERDVDRISGRMRLMAARRRTVASPSAKLMESMSSSDGARYVRCDREIDGGDREDRPAETAPISDDTEGNTFVQAAHPITLRDRW